MRDEARKLGIESGPIGLPIRPTAPTAGVTLVTNPGDKDANAPDKNRTPMSLVGRFWTWLSEDIPGLAEHKAEAIGRLDAEIRAILAEPRSNFLNLIALQSLLEARTGLVGGFPTSRLDFVLSGIDIIGLGMVGGKPILILQKGTKVITSADLAADGFRSRRALDLGKDVPYDSHLIRTWLEQIEGKGKVVSTTIPSADYRLIQLAGQRHPVTGIVFDTRGYPIFDDVARFDTRITSEMFWKTSADTHKRTATGQLRQAIDQGQIDRGLFNSNQLKAIYQGEREIPGFRWHHHQNLGRMQLVPASVHEGTLHLGGLGLRKGQ